MRPVMQCLGFGSADEDGKNSVTKEESGNLNSGDKGGDDDDEGATHVGVGDVRHCVCRGRSIRVARVRRDQTVLPGLDVLWRRRW